MFQSALVKLTGLYLLILMLVSVFFSVNLYGIASHEVDNRLQRQVNSLNFRPPPRSNFDLGIIEQERQQELQDSRQHVLVELIYINFVILLLGGAGSFLLARRTIRPIEEAHAAQARFTADASHELRTPVAAMRAETEVALRDPKFSAAKARVLLKSNIEELERLGELSKGLLQLARGAENGPLEEKILLKDVVATAGQQVMPLAKTKHIIITVNDVGETVIKGDKSQLVQLVVILLENAVKYSPPKRGITISATEHANQVHLSIKDQGSGIPAEDLPHIFERFYRVDAARSKSAASGHGLGLSIAKRIAEVHHGIIEASSTPGQGSVFTVSLPIVKN
ncbi:MAG TPA: HAMP domain-containing sensor histidine kinase [Candidatus Saccharimonadales bacterium]|nr:HAMP domain-containing sensor histidine kinase [Candidatus Saccharimonadales bacterium]